MLMLKVCLTILISRIVFSFLSVHFERLHTSKEVFSHPGSMGSSGYTVMLDKMLLSVLPVVRLLSRER